jgi:hypothetical protein
MGDRKDMIDIDPNGNMNSTLRILAYFVFGAMGFLAVLSVQSMTESLKEMNQSLHNLNAKMSVVVTTQDSHRLQLIDHEKRLRIQEKK